MNRFVRLYTRAKESKAVEGLINLRNQAAVYGTELKRVTRWDRWGRFLVPGVLLFFLCVVGRNAFNGVSGVAPLNDSGIFMAGGLSVLEGKTLYKEVWDHKPPMVHFLNAFAFKLGGAEVVSVRVMERYFAVALLLLFFVLVGLSLRSWLVALVGALYLQLHFFNNAIFDYGNLTEEYGAVFMVAGAVLAVVSRQVTGWKLWLAVTASGLLFSLAVFTKEPFLLASVPWFVYLMWRWDDGWKGAGLRAVAFVGGALIPALLISGYLVSNGAFRDWLDVVDFNMRNAAASRTRAAAELSLWDKFVRHWPFATKRIFEHSVMMRALFGLGLCSALWWPYLKRARFIPLVAVVAFGFNYWGTLLSARDFGHYFMQLAPDYVLVAMCGVGWILFMVSKHWSGKVWLTLFLALSAVWDVGAFSEYYSANLKRPFRAPGLGSIGAFIQANSTKDDLVWCSHQAVSRYYILSKRLSPTRYIYAPDHLFVDTKASTAAEKKALLFEELQANPPKFIVDWPKYARFARTLPVWRWVQTNYTLHPTIKEGEIGLWVRKGSENTHLMQFDPEGDYESKYSAINFKDGQWTVGDPAIEQQRAAARGALFFQFVEAAKSVEVIEAEYYENTLTRDHKRSSSRASGGKVVSREFGASANHFVEYSFYLDRDLPSGRLVARYATQDDGARYDVSIDGKAVGKMDFPLTPGWVSTGLETTEMDLPALTKGLHALKLRSNGKRVELDLLYFEEK